MRARGSLLSQLLVAFAVFAVLIGTAVTVSYVAAARQHQVANRLKGHYQVLQEADGKLGEAFATAQFAVLRYALTREPAYLRPLQPAVARYDRRLAILRTRATGDLRGLVSAQAGSGAAWFGLAPRITAVPPGTAAARALLTRSSRLTGAFFGAGAQMQQRMAQQIQRLTSASNRALTTGLAWSGAAAGVALLLVLAGSLSTLGSVSQPLRGLTLMVRRLTAGDHGARAPVAGSAEVREVAKAVNTQADEADRLRALEAQSSRLRAAARDAGLRIREHLSAADVAGEARTMLERVIPADVVYLQLITEGRISPPVGHERDWLLADTFDPSPQDDTFEVMHGLFRSQASLLLQDTSGPEGDRLPSWTRAPLRESGIRALILTPFGVGDDLLGLVVAYRVRDSRRWSRAEVDAVESIAADIGRGLHHAAV